MFLNIVLLHLDYCQSTSGNISTDIAVIVRAALGCWLCHFPRLQISRNAGL